MNTTSNKVLWAVGTVIIAVAISIVFIGTKPQTQSFGAAGITNLTGLEIGGTPGSFQVDSLAGATSTTQLGCIQTIATSSATNVKLIFSNLGATSTFNGTVYWNYGNCP